MQIALKNGNSKYYVVYIFLVTKLPEHAEKYNKITDDAIWFK